MAQPEAPAPLVNGRWQKRDWNFYAPKQWKIQKLNIFLYVSMIFRLLLKRIPECITDLIYQLLATRRLLFKNKWVESSVSL